MVWCGGGRATSDVLGGKKRIFGGGKRERRGICSVSCYISTWMATSLKCSDLALGKTGRCFVCFNIFKQICLEHIHIHNMLINLSCVQTQHKYIPIFIYL